MAKAARRREETKQEAGLRDALRLTSTDAGASGGDGESRVLSGVVKLRVGLEPEGVFPQALEFL